MTINHWVIVPSKPESVELLNRRWTFNYQRGLIAIGWPELGDVSHLSLDDLKEHRHRVYGEKYKLAHVTIWRFWHEISVGDKLIAKTGRRRMLAVGTVTREAFYDEDLGKEQAACLTDDYYPNFLGVDWELREFEFSESVFAIGTLRPITAERYQQLVDASPRQAGRRN